MDCHSWERWAPELAKACDGSHQTIEGIFAELQSGVTRLLEHEGCCFIVSINDYPGTKACQVWWAAGTLEAIIEALPDLHAWALLQGCSEMLVEGHPGWARALRNHDYAIWSVTLRKALHGHLH